MKFAEINELFERSVARYAEETGPDDDCNIIIIYNNSKRGLTLSSDSGLHPEGENASDTAFKRIGMLAAAFWLGVQRDFGQPGQSGDGLMSLASLLGALGGSHEENETDGGQQVDPERRIV